MGENPMNMMLNCHLGPYVEGLQQLATHTKRHAVATKTGLLPKLKLYKQMAVAMQEQFKRRTAIGTTIDSMNNKVKDLLNQSTKLAGKPGKEKKVGELEASAADLQERISQQKELLEQVTQMLAWEFDRYNSNKNRDVLGALQNYAVNYTEFAAKEAEMWKGISGGVVSAPVCPNQRFTQERPRES